MNDDLVSGGDVLQDRYRILERLAAGGMASVWRATDEVLDRTVAVKVLDGRSLEDGQSKARLRAEAKILARLNHPRVASVYDFGLVDGIPYLVMELVDGVTLAQLIARPEGVPWQLAVEICAQTAQALDAAHECGLVHRDVSPSNILWTRTGVKVIDFGLCASAGDPEETDGLHGTPAYMAPERIVGEPVTPASDVYALAVVLYRALADRLPWPTESVVQLLGAHRTLPPLPLAVSGLPASVADVCERCLAKDPDQRPSAAEVASILTAALASAAPAGATVSDPHEATVADGSLMTAPILPQRKKLSHPVAVAASAVGLIAATGLATTLVTHSTPPKTQASAAEQALTDTSECHVDYRLMQDTGDRFAATVTVKNTGSEAYAHWRLVFGLPGEQTVDPAQADDWSYDDGVVTSQPQSELAPGTEAKLAFDGRYTGSNPFPTTFLLSDRRCSASLLGVAGRPLAVTIVAPQSLAPQKPQAPSGGGESDEKGKAKGHKGDGESRGQDD
jgi:serine/threonine-protein kinase